MMAHIFAKEKFLAHEMVLNFSGKVARHHETADFYKSKNASCIHYHGYQLHRFCNSVVMVTFDG